VIVNQSITFGCPVQGRPEPEVNWLVNGQLLQEGTSTRGVRLSGDKKEVGWLHLLWGIPTHCLVFADHHRGGAT
jgi:hypothetical protein